MKAALIRYILSVLLFGILCIAISSTNEEDWLTAWFILLIFMALPLMILTWVELGRAMRDSPAASRPLRILGILFGLPQALFGLLALIAGVAIIIWIIYNSLMARQPEYSGGIFTFGIGPALTLFGVYWIRDAFSRYNKTTDIKPHSIDDE